LKVEGAEVLRDPALFVWQEGTKVKISRWIAGLAFALAGLAAGQAADDKPYQVADGNKVDKATLEGWRTWRALACERCHGPKQEGLVGPSLLESLRRLSKEEFKQTLMKGRPEKGMPNFDGSKMVTDNLDGLYAYLKGRSDGAIQPGRLEELK
jgi:mono/diheme cytochrome c family protein